MKPILFCSVVAALIVAVQDLGAADPPTGVPDGYKLAYEQKFASAAAFKNFVFSDPKAWRLAKDGDGFCLELFGKSEYEPKHRSPFNIALVTDKVFGDFVLEAELQSTVKPYNHQDMCVFFGFQDTNHYYYVHIAVKPDPVKAESHAHDIFIVNDAPRLCFAREVSNGVAWGQDVWHQVRVVRRADAGAVEVFFDDLTKPIMRGEDRNFAKGLIGFGSFDDLGKVRNIRVWAPSVEAKKTEFFPGKAE